MARPLFALYRWEVLQTAADKLSMIGSSRLSKLINSEGIVHIAAFTPLESYKLHLAAREGNFIGAHKNGAPTLSQSCEAVAPPGLRPGRPSHLEPPLRCSPLTGAL